MERQFKITPAFILLYLIPFIAFAQQVKLVDSYSQSWSGGIAGRHGERFSFTIDFLKVKTDVIPDTIWIGEQAIPLSVTDSQLSDLKNTKRIKKKNSVRFEIHAGTHFDDYEYKQIQPGDQQKKAEAKPPYPYKCVALLSFIYKGNKRYFEINRIMHTGQPVSYP